MAKIKAKIKAKIIDTPKFGITNRTRSYAYTDTDTYTRTRTRTCACTLTPRSTSTSSSTSSSAPTPTPALNLVRTATLVSVRAGNKLINSAFYLIALNFIGILFFGLPLKADILFEGYYQLYIQNQPLGYSIQKYEFDSATKQFVSTSFLKTNEMGGNTTESIKTYADENFKPVKYLYTFLSGTGESKTIDGQIKGEKLLATVKAGSGKQNKIVADMPKGVFFSQFLVYVILKSPSGLSAQNSFSYKAIAEEDASVTSGQAQPKGATKYLDKIPAIRFENIFKDSKYTSYVTEKGEVLETQSPLQGIKMVLVPDPSIIKKQYVLPEKIIKSVFGNVPLGVRNIAYDLNQKGEWPGQSSAGLVSPQAGGSAVDSAAGRASQSGNESSSLEVPEMTKQKGVPAGRGIHVKPGGK